MTICRYARAIRQRQLPEPIVKYLEKVRLTPTKRQAEVGAYWKIQELIETSSNVFAKRFHAQTLE